MDITQAQQLVESIKTLNLNLNSQSAVDIVNRLTPLVWVWFLDDIFSIIFWGGIFIGIVWIICRTILKYKEIKVKNRERY